MIKIDFDTISYVRLGDIADVFKGQQILESDTGTEARLISYNDLFTTFIGGKIDTPVKTYNFSKKRKDCMVKATDIVFPVFPNRYCTLIVKSNPFIKPYFLNDVYDSSNIIVRVNRDIVYEDYVYQVLTSTKMFEKIHRLSKNKKQKRLTVADISNITIPLISLEEQRIIMNSFRRMKDASDYYYELIDTLFKQEGD